MKEVKESYNNKVQYKAFLAFHWLLKYAESFHAWIGIAIELQWLPRCQGQFMTLFFRASKCNYCTCCTMRCNHCTTRCISFFWLFFCQNTITAVTIQYNKCFSSFFFWVHASIIDHRTYGCMDLRTEKNCKSRNKPTLKYVAEQKK